MRTEQVIPIEPEITASACSLTLRRALFILGVPTVVAAYWVMLSFLTPTRGAALGTCVIDTSIVDLIINGEPTCESYYTISCRAVLANTTSAINWLQQHNQVDMENVNMANLMTICANFIQKHCGMLHRIYDNFGEYYDTNLGISISAKCNSVPSGYIALITLSALATFITGCYYIYTCNKDRARTIPEESLKSTLIAGRRSQNNYDSTTEANHGFHGSLNA